MSYCFRHVNYNQLCILKQKAISPMSQSEAQNEGKRKALKRTIEDPAAGNGLTRKRSKQEEAPSKVTRAWICSSEVYLVQELRKFRKSVDDHIERVLAESETHLSHPIPIAEAHEECKRLYTGVYEISFANYYEELQDVPLNCPPELFPYPEPYKPKIATFGGIEKHRRFLLHDALPSDVREQMLFLAGMDAKDGQVNARNFFTNLRVFHMVHSSPPEELAAADGIIMKEPKLREKSQKGGTYDLSCILRSEDESKVDSKTTVPIQAFTALGKRHAYQNTEAIKRILSGLSGGFRSVGKDGALVKHILAAATLMNPFLCPKLLADTFGFPEQDFESALANASGITICQFQESTKGQRKFKCKRRAPIRHQQACYCYLHAQLVVAREILKESKMPPDKLQAV